MSGKEIFRIHLQVVAGYALIGGVGAVRDWEGVLNTAKPGALARRAD